MAAELSALKGLDFLSSADLNGAQTQALLTLAADIKAGRRNPRLDGKVLGPVSYTHLTLPTIYSV